MQTSRLILILLLLTSCASTKRRIITDSEPYAPKCLEVDFMNKIELCMMKFAKQGFDSEGIVKMCGKVYERRD